MKFQMLKALLHEDSPVTVLKLRLFVALGLTAILLMVGQAVTFGLTESHLHNSRVINIAGRQRMLSQQISKIALLIRTPISEKERPEYLNELKQSVSLFELSHNGLLRGDAQLGLPKENDPKVISLLNEMDPYYNSLLTAAKKLPNAIKNNDAVLAESLTMTILENEKPFLERMNNLVFYHDKTEKEKINFLGQVNFVFLVLFLLLLLLEGILIFRPAINYVKKSFNQLKELDSLKDEFVSLASHELRTPMTSISGFVDMMREGRYGPVTKELQEPLGYIAQSTERLIRMVNDLLNVSRIESGRMKFTFGKVDLGAIAVKVVEGLQPVAKQRKLELTIDTKEGVLVQADNDRVEEILHNLIGNSLKFTDTGKVSVSVRSEDEMGVVAVVDTGIGIPDEGRSKLFGKFEQISTDAAARPNGTGLGLYLSRKVAQKMGGDIILVESALHVGSKFALNLPIVGSSKAKLVNKQIESEQTNTPDQK